jgi:hypothetical protein
MSRLEVRKLKGLRISVWIILPFKFLEDKDGISR